MTGQGRTSSKMELRTEFLYNQQCHSHQPSKFATLDPKSGDLVCLNRRNDDLYLVTCRLVQLAYMCNGQIKHHRHVLFVEVLIKPQRNGQKRQNDEKCRIENKFLFFAFFLKNSSCLHFVC